MWYVPASAGVGEGKRWWIAGAAIAGGDLPDMGEESSVRASVLNH